MEVCDNPAFVSDCVEMLECACWWQRQPSHLSRMFAAGRQRAALGQPAARDDDDADWLRVGRSFQGEPAKSARDNSDSAALGRRDRYDHRRNSNDERALQVYKSKGDKSKKKKAKKQKRGDKSRRRSASRSSSGSDVEYASHGSSERRKKRKRNHATDDGSGDSDRDRGVRSKHVGGDTAMTKPRRSRSKRDSDYDDERQLVETPAHGELEVYRSKHHGGSELYEYDCVGDRDNHLFGTLYAHEQPAYRLATRRSVVDGAWVVERQKVKHAAEAKHEALPDSERYFSPASRKIERRAGQRRFHLAYSEKRLARLNATTSAGELAFIPLEPILVGELDDGTGEDCTLSQSALLQTDLESIEHFLVTKSKQLNERVAAHPTNVEAWLDLIAFQEQSQRLSGKRSVREHDDVVLEKQKAVLVRAIEKNPNNRSLGRLKMNMLWLELKISSEKSVDPALYRVEVERLLENDPTNADVWLKLIAYSQQKFSSFTMTMLRDLYARVISILNKELARLLNEKRHASTSIKVFGEGSLLGAADPYDGTVLDEQTHHVARSLLNFHRLMVESELKSGYTERAIAHIQALIHLNFDGREVLYGPNSQIHSLQRFASQWNENSERIGDSIEDDCIRSPQYLPPLRGLDEFVHDHLITLVSKMNPPAEIRTHDHVRSLTWYSKHHTSEYLDNGARDNSDASTNHKRSGKWVYSNLHGHRIWVEDADDGSKYQQILEEIRGSDKFQSRQYVAQQRLQKMQRSVAAETARAKDERVEHDDVSTHDEHVEWLCNEVRADMTQWNPLRSSCPEHLQLIEQQPDRAILTDELIPFLFRVPRAYQVDIALSLLTLLGVSAREDIEGAAHDAGTLYNDCLDEHHVLTRPILDVLSPGSKSTLELDNSTRLGLLREVILSNVNVSPLARADPSRVQFIRNVFLWVIHRSKSRHCGLLTKIMSMWIGYETQLLRHSGSSDAEVNEIRALCQELMKGHLTQARYAHIDTLIISEYAMMELALGNQRQVERICEKTLSALHVSSHVGASTDRKFHRLIFLRVRLELWRTIPQMTCSMDATRKHRALYVLWQPWNDGSESLEHLTKAHRKKPSELISSLRMIFEARKFETVERYRMEFDIALAQCNKSGNGGGARRENCCSVAYALHNLCAALYTVNGFHSAQREFEEILSKESREGVECHSKLSWLVYLEFMQAHHATRLTPFVSPREWRGAVAGAVGRFPTDSLLLRLFVDAETSNTMSQTLRRYFQQIRERWQRHLDSPHIVQWLFALLCEISRAERSSMKFSTESSSASASLSQGNFSTCCLLHRWGKNQPAMDRIRRVFEEMVDQVQTMGNALGWRLFIRFEIAMGKVDAAKKVFYRGLTRCPWSKALYLDGIRILRAYLTDRECREMMDFMVAKQLHVRIDD